MGILGLEYSTNDKGVVMFFVIDFETSGLMPWIGSPLTLGIVPVNEAGEILDQDLYVEFPTWHLMPDWDMPANLSDTESWWNQKRLSDDEKEVEAWRAAWLREEDEDSSGQAIGKITDFLQVIEPERNNRFLCANPVKFDGMWMDYIYSTITDGPVPYSHRSLCLRSMQYGLDYGVNPEYGSRPGIQESAIPHHALYDARSEAVVLADLMNRGRIVQEYLSDTRYLLDPRWHTNIEFDS